MKLAKDIVHNRQQIARLTTQKKVAEAQLGVLNTTRELQNTIEHTSREIADLKARNEMLSLITYNEGPQLSELVASLATSPVSQAL